jgi:hypothetical protein
MFRNGTKRRIFIPEGGEITERIKNFIVFSLRQVKGDGWAIWHAWWR